MKASRRYQAPVTTSIRTCAEAAVFVIATAILVVVSPLTSVALGALLLCLVALVSLGDRARTIYLSALGSLLVGYAFFGRGFAHLGVSPIYIGEVVLLFGLIVAIIFGASTINRFPALFGLLTMFLLAGAASTIPYIGTYGVLALRDATSWGYALFAFIVASLTSTSDRFFLALRAYKLIIPWFLAWTPVAFAIYRFVPDIIPTTPGSNVLFLHLKPGDVAVHLVGAASFIVLGLATGRAAHGRAGRDLQDIRLWLLFIFGAAFTLTSRAAMATLALGILTTFLVRPSARWGKALYVLAITIVLVAATDARLEFASGSSSRSVSVNDVSVAITSVFQDSGQSVYDGTRQWRTMWWKDIIEYTMRGPYFWTGKGYGINLADADGYQVLEDGSLRNPHSSHLTFLARGGVPALVLWAALQVTFGASLLRAASRARKRMEYVWSQVFAWIFAYWLAFLINSSFDVYLEGPQGGIWFWSLFGFGIAAMAVQRREEQMKHFSEPARQY